MDLLFKNNLPLNFYFYRLLLIPILIFLILYFHPGFWVIVTFLLGAFVGTLNMYYYALEVYSDRFIITLPNIFGKRFDETYTYYFINISDFEFERENYHPTNWKIKFGNYYFYPSIYPMPRRYWASKLNFKYSDNGKTKNIYNEFLHDDPEIFKGLIMIENIIKKDRSTTHHHSQP